LSIRAAEVKFKRLHPDAVIPEYQTEGAAGADLRSVANVTIYPRQVALVPLGFSVSFPAHLEMQIRPRSGLAFHSSVTVLNAPGTIDSDYRGEVKVILINHGTQIYRVSQGERVAQAVFHEVVKAQYVEVEELDEAARDKGGFGSTGRS